jgi:RNA recognition motif-containing protein
MLIDLLGEHGFNTLYDFVYLPMDFRNGVNLGYAFVNLLNNPDAMRAMDLFHGFSSWFLDSAKVCEVSWAHPHQGLAEHVERYRNSPVMHATMPDEYKPMVFRNGVRLSFPPPTKAIRAPKLRPVRDREGRQDGMAT